MAHSLPELVQCPFRVGDATPAKVGRRPALAYRHSEASGEPTRLSVVLFAALGSDVRGHGRRIHIGSSRSAAPICGFAPVAVHARRTFHSVVQSKIPGTPSHEGCAARCRAEPSQVALDKQSVVGSDT